MTKKGEIYIKVIAERLKVARNEKAKTQSDLAEVLNISRAAFGEYERGNNLPPIYELAENLEAPDEHEIETRIATFYEVAETLKNEKIEGHIKNQLLKHNQRDILQLQRRPGAGHSL